LIKMEQAPPSGPLMHELKLGGASVFRVASPPRRITRSAALAERDALSETFKLLVQVEGNASVRQGGRRAELKPGMLALIDGRQALELEMPQAFCQVLVQLPRSAVLGRYAGIERRTAIAGDAQHAGDALLRDYVLSLAQSGQALDPRARLHASAALIELLGGADSTARRSPAAALGERALALIDIHLADSAFTPEALAGELGVSRRHLDALLARSGRTVSAELWERRLQRAARQLQAGPEAPSVTEVCYAAGFRDPAHFSRAFRRRFGCSPREFRQREHRPS
jgi:AraC-like DNA-binding protein